MLFRVPFTNQRLDALSCEATTFVEFALDEGLVALAKAMYVAPCFERAER